MDFIFSIPQSQMFTFNGGTASIPLTVNTPGIFITEINDTIENGIYIRLGYKDTTWFGNNTTFVLKSGEHVYNSDTGQYKIGDGTTELQDLIFYGGQSSTASNITADNGLTKTGDNIQWGGTLLQSTTINGGGNELVIGSATSSIDSFSMKSDNTIAFNTTTGNFNVDADNGSVFIDSTLHTNRGTDAVTNRTTSNLLQIVEFGSVVINNGSNNMFIITDNNGSKGMVYQSDYSANFTPESLITKRYLTNYVATASSNISANNGLTVSGNNVQLGGTLISDTSINGGGFLFEFGTSGNRLDSLNVFANNDFNVQADNDINLTALDEIRTIGLYQNLIGHSSISIATDNVSFNVFDTASVITNNGSNNNIIVTDDISNKGIVYGTDYSPNFTPESLITKRYVDNKIALSASNIKAGTVLFGVDGGGGTVLAGTIKASFTMPNNGIFTGWVISGSTAGSAIFDVWKTTDGSTPTVANTITDGFKPTIGSSSYATSTGLTGWGITYSAGNRFYVTIDSISAFTWIDLQLNKNDFL